MRSWLAACLALLLIGSCAPAPYRSASSEIAVAAEAPFYVQPERMAAKRIQVAKGPVDLVFIGDSITQNYEKQSANPAENYKPVWDAFYGRRNALDLGYGMDTTGATLWRFERGSLTASRRRSPWC